MYKRIIFSLALMLCMTTGAMYAQGPQVKKANQATFSLNTFRADGTVLSTSHGVFINSQGEAISQWKPFEGAAKAVVIDSKGKKYDVDGLIAANELYDVCKFHIKGTTESAVISKSTLQANSKLWIGCYGVKDSRLVPATIGKVETFTAGDQPKEYPYYIVNGKIPQDIAFCPLINDNGEVVALIQSNTDDTANGVSALFPSDMQLQQQIGETATTLAKSNIAPMLPKDYNEASIALLLSAQNRKGDAYLAVVEQFINMFPQKVDGYENRARLRMNSGDYQGAKADMEKAISVAEDKAEAHYTYSNLILDKELYYANDQFEGWNLEMALNEAKAAYQTTDHPAYLQQQGKVLFAMQKYDEAYNTYMKLQDTSLAGPETMYAAVICKQNSNAPLEELIILMDSTIAVCPHPLTFQSAPYVLQRGIIYQQHSQYRKAIADFANYEKLMVGNNLPASFYYNRFVCEREGHIYQQALEDITKATELEPYNSVYFCELGSFQIRLKKNDEAIASANKAILLDRKNADAYAVLGVAQCLAGKKHEGVLNLEEAKSLGYEGADELINKYK